MSDAKEPVPAYRRYDLTDVERAQLFVEKFKNRLGYVHAWKSWIRWTGQRWKLDGEERVRLMAHTLADDYRTQALETAVPEERTACFKLAKVLQLGKTISAMLTEARPMVALLPDRFDTDRGVLNTPFSTIDLKSGVGREPDPIDNITKKTGSQSDVHSGCSAWLRFLHTVTGGSTETMDFIQRAVGYSLTGYTTERAAFFLYGSGRNGKSTFIQTLKTALGDYAGVASSSLILVGRDDKAFYDLAMLRGKRFVVASETGKDQKMATAFFKLITGDEEVTARHLYGDFFTFRPQFKLWVATNHRPGADADDDGFWDRMRLIPFTVRIPDEDVDRELARKLQAELPGILRWAIDGAVIWTREGLGQTAAVTEATRQYREDSDTFGRWVEECCEITPGHRFRTGPLFDSWKRYANQLKVPAGDTGEFVLTLERKGFERQLGGQKKSYIMGLTLRQAGDTED